MSFKTLRVHTRPFVEMTPKRVANTGCALSVKKKIYFISYSPPSAKGQNWGTYPVMLFPFSRSVAGGDGFLNAQFIVKTTRFIAELQRFLAMQLQLKVKHTVRPRLTDTHLIRSPHYYRQFALSLAWATKVLTVSLNSNRSLRTPRQYRHFLWPPQCPWKRN